MKAEDLREGAWRGFPAFLVGGGPSLKTFDFSRLTAKIAAGYRCIVVNGSFLNVPNADVFFTEDWRFLELISGQLDEKKPTEAEATAWRRFEGLKVVNCLDESYRERILGAAPNAHLIPKKTKDKRWSKRFEDGLSYSSNSMIGAMNLADLLGANPLYVLGVDCLPVGKNTCNYHDLYPRSFHTGDDQYRSFASDFTHWAAPHLKASGKTVINLNPDSGVTVWPRRSWEEHFDAAHLV